ncbi:MAG: hypothetical protein M1834_002382 [Cirrosporium novae-zelandiae]|nr:MAG: hypothetical protein M1834_002382 [Cirrosporium novae-zelandiae]
MAAQAQGSTISDSELGSTNQDQNGSNSDLEMAEKIVSQLDIIPSPPKEIDADHQLTEWSGPDDPDHPYNWSFKLKIWISILLAIITISIGLSSSILSSGTAQIASEFNISTEITILGTSLFLLGFVIGPAFWGPMSEKIGRRYPIIGGQMVASIFCIMVAEAKNPATLIVGRFLSGVFGAAPITIVGGAVADIWNALDRGIALGGVVGMIWGGPILGPIIGNFVTESYLGWRWTMWLMAIFGGSVSIISFMRLPETYAPIVLSKKARRIRKETGNPNIRSLWDEEETNLAIIVQVYLVRPWVLLFTEPILVFVTVYQAFIYGTCYLFFIAYPIQFHQNLNWPLGLSSLPFLAMLLGVLLGTTTIIFHTKLVFVPKTIQNNNVVIPEHRLPLMILGSFLIPLGLFWFAWTSNPGIPWPAVVFAGVPIGAGMYIVFIQCFSYVIDVYLRMASSSLAVMSIVRSLFGVAFPLFGTYMYEALGVAWATSLLGFLSALMVPVPIIFYLYGHTIRMWSKRNLNTV